MAPSELSKLTAEIRELLAKVPDTAEGMTSHQSRALRAELEHVAGELRQRLAGLDPTRQPDSFFNPSDPSLFGVFAAIALIGQDRVPLASVESARFYGSGVYALYYNGAVPAYQPIARSEHPIYVGKANPAARGARTPQEQGDRLCDRLNEHRKNIVRAATTLSVADFQCRYLVVQSGFQEQAEAALIHLFHPAWNSETKILYGFGKHGDSAETRGNKRSPWDTMHPGRKWAGNAKLKDASTTQKIEDELSAHFSKYPVVPDLQHVLHELVAQIKKKAS